MASKIDKENSLFMVLFKQGVVKLKGSLTYKNHGRPEKNGGLYG